MGSQDGSQELFIQTSGFIFFVLFCSGLADALRTSQTKDLHL